MAERVELAISEAERGKIADDLRRYGAYRERTGIDLWNTFTEQKPHELEPPNLTQEIKDRTASHHAVAKNCVALASAIESENPVLLTPETIQLIQEAFGDIYGGELPPRAARTAMFSRMASRRMSEAAADGSLAPAEFVAVNAELQPSDPERYEAAIMHYLTEANAKISEQLTELRTRQEALHTQLRAQQREIDQLRTPGTTRRQLPNPFRSTSEPTVQASRRRGPSDDGPAL